VDLYLQKESKWEDANKESIGLCDRSKEKVYTKKEKGISIIKGREREGVQFFQRTIEKRVYQALKVILNNVSVFCRKKI